MSSLIEQVKALPFTAAIEAIGTTEGQLLERLSETETALGAALATLARNSAFREVETIFTSLAKQRAIQSRRYASLASAISD